MTFTHVERTQMKELLKERMKMNVKKINAFLI